MGKDNERLSVKLAAFMGGPSTPVLVMKAHVRRPKCHRRNGESHRKLVFTLKNPTMELRESGSGPLILVSGKGPMHDFLKIQKQAPKSSFYLSFMERSGKDFDASIAPDFQLTATGPVYEDPTHTSTNEFQGSELANPLQDGSRTAEDPKANTKDPPVTAEGLTEPKEE